MLITLPKCAVRDWHLDDTPSLAEHANDRRIWLNLRDRFPHPYALADAEAFLASVAEMRPRTFFAIVIESQAVGAIGYTPLRRIYAVPYAWSSASARVLEKAGYRLEGRMRQSAIKDGRVTDQLLYAILRDVGRTA